jgi:AcrR family transcriptional regulator
MRQKRRGRPRAFTETAALAAAVDVFSSRGFTGASLDDLSAAMNMSRPSIYNAFGDKEGVYRQALAFFVGRMRAAVQDKVIPEPDLAKALDRFYLTALGVYFADTPPRGCFLFCTAPVEAITHPEILSDLAALTQEIDTTLEAKFRQAQALGDYAPDVDAKSVARIAQGVLHTLAIRARAGESHGALKRLARTAVKMLCAFGDYPRQV